jgi:beta-aspartyl-peptidase (threonine type)
MRDRSEGDSPAGRDDTSATASWGTAHGSSAWAVLVHGGAGDRMPGHIDRHQEGCRAAARVAAQVLRAGGSALDAVERAVVVLEDDPNFNAGTGASLNEEGLIELDASVIEGAGLRAGGVCALPPFRNPISIARAVLEDGRHVLYAGEGAARFAVDRGFSRSTSEALTTEAAKERWLSARARANRGDTVGAVARDASGTVAAATSTGGRASKRPGRVGDSPVLGAGTYADNDAGACSATGDGEAILRVGLARSAIDRMREGAVPEDVARAVLEAMRGRVGGTGGVILVDRLGRLGLARSAPTMVWAAAGETLEVVSGY